MVTADSDRPDLDDVSRAALDLSVTDTALPPEAAARRRVFAAAGILPRTAGGAPVHPATDPPARGAPRRYRPSPQPRFWLAGDHHVHTVFSPDGRYTILDQAVRAAEHGLDWMVVTDHGGPEHVRVGVDLTAVEIAAARRLVPDLLLFQGLEWQIPAAEHGTVIVAPGREDLGVLRDFEADFDGRVREATAWTNANEALALAGLRWLGAQLDAGRVHDLLFLANHPARQGIDSPHEIRNWRDTEPRVAIGFEGAPGHQAAGMALPGGPGENRGYYGRDRGTDPNQYQPYPQESYRTWGGFDWMSATVGGLWDSMLAEGLPWCISANSDSHQVRHHAADRPPGADPALFAREGRYPDPVYTGTVDPTAADFWPGQYSRTVVGARSRTHRSVLAGLRAGRVWVDHGRLVSDIAVRWRRLGQYAGAGLGETLTVPRGTRTEVAVRVRPARVPNAAGFVPSLARVDLIVGRVDPAAVSSRDSFTAPDTRVVRSWDVSGAAGTIDLRHRLEPADGPRYVRVRATDGNHGQPGLLGAALDPAGPRMDPAAASDPWQDLWLYTNPVWLETT